MYRAITAALLLATPLQATLSVYPTFADHAVLQRDKPVTIWGTAKPNQQVKVLFEGQHPSASSDSQGHWKVVLQAMPANTTPQTMTVLSAGERLTLMDILVGDVWVLGGQSNMEHPLCEVTNGDLEILSAHHPKLRLLTMPRGVAHQPRHRITPINQLDDFYGNHERKGSWFQCTPESARYFSAIGYAFGLTLHAASGIPIGLVDASRGGTMVETWVSRQSLEAIPSVKPLLKYWDKRVADWDPAKAKAAQLKHWEARCKWLQKMGRKAPPKPTTPPESPADNMNRPCNCYNDMLYPLSGLTVRGVLFNQGYSNAMTGWQVSIYAPMLEAMINDWRKAFHDPHLPFGIIGLTAGGAPQTMKNFDQRMIDDGIYIREAQQKVAKKMHDVVYLPSWDKQEDWVHPADKLPLGVRAARWALANVMKPALHVDWKPAQPVDIRFNQGPDKSQAVVTFDRYVRTHDGRPITGFAIAGADRVFYPAEAQHPKAHGGSLENRKTVIVFSPFVPHPVALRFAWARCPDANLFTTQTLRNVPVPCFRTDSWPFTDSPGPGMHSAHRALIIAALEKAKQQDEQRLKQEAHRVLAK